MAHTAPPECGVLTSRRRGQHHEVRIAHHHACLTLSGLVNAAKSPTHTPFAAANGDGPRALERHQLSTHDRLTIQSGKRRGTTSASKRNSGARSVPRTTPPA